jgi:hypothetical protein
VTEEELKIATGAPGIQHYENALKSPMVKKKVSEKADEKCTCCIL